MTATAANDVVAMARDALTLRQLAEKALADARRERAADDARHLEHEKAERQERIARWMAKWFDLGPTALTISDDGSGDSAIAQTADGLRFQVRDDGYDEQGLYVEKTCAACTRTTWANVGSFNNSNALEDLGFALSTPGHCAYREGCNVVPAVAETKTVDDGRTAIPTVGSAFEHLERSGDALADAVKLEMEFADRAGPEKAAAVRRLMAERNLAATPAEKIVEEDPGYAQFCADRRDAVASRIRAEAAFAGAKISVQLAANLAEKAGV